MAKKDMHVIRGEVHWAKILGDPVLNYGGDAKEWTMDVKPDAEGLQTLKDIGLGGRIKNKGDDRGDFVQFRQKEKRLDGSYNRRISVTDAAGNPWPQDRLIGNGTIVDVKFEKKDYGAGKQPGVYPQAVRILEHKEYQRQEFAPLPADDPYAKNVRLPEGMEPIQPKAEEVAQEFPE
jgi:hypothetical protein